MVVNVEAQGAFGGSGGHYRTPSLAVSIAEVKSRESDCIKRCIMQVVTLHKKCMCTEESEN